MAMINPIFQITKANIMSLEWNDDQMMNAGLDPKKVLSIARRLQNLSREMGELGLSVYGNSGYGFLTHVSQSTHIEGGEANPNAVIAHLGNGFDGGDW